ncbi:MAG: hypothetical protein LQ351_002932 [Letrouitia transgressa]|nr:MAG: hypothetical protein LQ351_002932 [Letrouitia transgressa]
MDLRAAIAPSLPPLDPTVSYWQDPPHALSTYRASNLPESASVVIVGSGISGATIASELLQRPSPPDVLLLEARNACSGATGRNGGHTKCSSYRAFLDNVQDQGEQEAAKIARFEYNCMKAVHAFAREKGIECDSWEGNTVDIIYDQAQWSRAKRAISEIRRILGEHDPVAQYTLYNAEETAEKFLAEGAIGAVLYAAGSLSAYKLVMGMLKLAIRKGLNLQTDTPVLKLQRSKDGKSEWIVETPRGMIRAKKVIMATNGYTAYLYPPLQGIIVPLRGTVTAQRPGSKMPKDGLKTTYSFIYRNGYEYMIFRPPDSKFAGDLVIGGCATKATEEGLYEWGTVDDMSVNPEIGQFVRESAAQYFGSHWGDDHPQGRVRRQWTGIMGYSSQGFPLVGEIPNEANLWVAASFQGQGMVLCLHTAKALVNMMYGEDGEALDTWFPQAFRMSEDRFKHKFRGRLHETAPKDLKVQSQL